MDQTQIFTNGEGDAWFNRNRSALGADEPEWTLRMCAEYVTSESTVLEVGCSNGRNLSWLSSRFGCACSGVDPSQAAILDGQKRDSSLTLAVGTAESIPYNGPFDTIILGFFLYLCDRESLPLIISEVHQRLRVGGHLVIVDFDHSAPTRVPYKHAVGVTTYKMDYSRLFLAYPQYALAERKSGSHSGARFEQSPDERISCTVLVKGEINHGFAPQT